MYRFRIADSSDEPSVRSLLAETPMPGDMAVTFEHEPDHFRALLPTGLNCRTLIAADNARIAGMLCRSVGQHYLNGQPGTLGYLGELRIRSENRSGTILARGMGFLSTVEQTDGCRNYFSVIADGNSTALRSFTEQRHRTFPQFKRICGIRTFGIVIDTRRQRRPAGIHSGAYIPIEDIILFLNTVGAARQFFPVYTKAHFSAFQECGLRREDIFVSVRGGAIVGVTAYWDMTSVRQTVVRAYSPILRTMMPLYNAFLTLTGARTLPRIGERIDAAYAAFTCVKDNDIEIYRSVLAAAITRACALGKAYLMAGFTDNDPLMKEALRHRHILYRSSFYAAMDMELDERMPYVEIASL